MKRYIGILTVIALLIIAFDIYLAFPYIKSALAANHLLPEPEKFTELYFTDHLKLPSQVKADEPYSFRFTVRNLEYSTMTYPYEVYIDDNGVKQYIDRGSFVLSHNESKTISEEFVLEDPGTRSAVIVNLPKKDQYIKFWMEGGK